MTIFQAIEDVERRKPVWMVISGNYIQYSQEAPTYSGTGYMTKYIYGPKWEPKQNDGVDDEQ